MKRLSPKQIQALVLEARKAFRYLAFRARARGEDFDDSLAAFEDFRHREVLAACGISSLRMATNSQFQIIKAHFLSLAAEDGAAMESLLAAGTEKARQMVLLIERELEGAGLPDEYASSISLDRWREPFWRELDNVTHLQHLLFTIRRRAGRKRNREAQPL